MFGSSNALLMTLLNQYRLWLRIKNRFFSTAIRSSFAAFGKGSLIQLPASLWGESAISIGARVHFGANSWLHALAPTEDGHAVVINIGDGCIFSGDVTISATLGVTIEKDVIVGRGVHISDHSHEFRDVTVPIQHQGVTKARRVTIGSGSWIGQGAIICPGVNIGKNAVVGGNSVVRSDVPDFCVHAGIPARFIRKIT
jgi:acetyltransferase-like isoleucine patch superfamily enzyme